MLQLHREPTGTVFHFADGSFIRCIRWPGRKEDKIAMSIEQISIPPEMGSNRALRSIHRGVFLEGGDGSRRCIWEGTGAILYVPGRRFPYVCHYFLPMPGVEETLGLW